MDGTVAASLYDTSNVDHSEEMARSRDRAVALINAAYRLAEDSFKEHRDALGAYILSNRGSFAFVSLLGDLRSKAPGALSQSNRPRTSALLS